MGNEVCNETLYMMTYLKLKILPKSLSEKHPAKNTIFLAFSNEGEGILISIST